MAFTSIAITNCNDYNYGSQKEDYCYGNVFVMKTLKQDNHSGDFSGNLFEMKIITEIFRRFSFDKKNHWLS